MIRWLSLALLIFAGCASPSHRPSGASSSQRDSGRTEKAAEPAHLSRKCEDFCQTIARAAKEAGHADLAEQLCTVARCETGNKCVASIQSARGRYKGAFQYAGATWRSQCHPIFHEKGVRGCDPKPKMNNLRCATICASEMIARGGIGNWPVCGKR